MTIATTHHGELKAFAQSTTGVSNASVELIPETLAPTYHLVIGLPGRSNALAIARRLGMPEEIVSRAREDIAPEQLQIEHLLTEIQQERDDLQAAGRRERTAAREAEEIRQELSRRLDAIERERDEALDEVRSGVEEELREARLKLRTALRGIERDERERADIAAANQAMAHRRRRCKEARAPASEAEAQNARGAAIWHFAGRGAARRSTLGARFVPGGRSHWATRRPRRRRGPARVAGLGFESTKSSGSSVGPESPV